MSMFATPLRPPLPRAVPEPLVLARDYLILARDHVELCPALYEIAAEGRFSVVVDRRKAERRRDAQPDRAERRRGERRQLLGTVAQRRLRPYVLIRERNR